MSQAFNGLVIVTPESDGGGDRNTYEWLPYIVVYATTLVDIDSWL